MLGGLSGKPQGQIFDKTKYEDNGKIEMDAAKSEMQHTTNTNQTWSSENVRQRADWLSVCPVRWSMQVQAFAQVLSLCSDIRYWC